MGISVWMAVLVLVVEGAGVTLLLLRPMTTAASTFDADVLIECTAATGLDSAGCRDRDDAILAEGSPTTTFEAEDLVRPRIDRARFGFGGGLSSGVVPRTLPR